jgi:hypothetical protein
MYLILSAVPTIALSEIGVRGSVAIFLLQNFTENLSAVFLATTCIWIINLAIPALLGNIFLYKTKI